MKVSVIGGGPGGLYFSLLAKKSWPDWEITVYDRDPAGNTFGFGVVFSDETLDVFHQYDAPSYEAIRRSFAYWGEVDVHYKGTVKRYDGNGFCGTSRVELLRILRDRCLELNVTVRLEHEVGGIADFPDSDLIVCADGINSGIRETHADHFGTKIDWRPNKFIWMGSTKELDAFNYFFKDTEHGAMVAHCYQYQPGRSTWIIEMGAHVYDGFGFESMGEAEAISVIEDLYADELDGHSMVADRLAFRNFPHITNETWVLGNAVLVGDAKASAHYSIGSGTKLAMEDAVALFEALRAHGTVDAALHDYDTVRREEVEKTQHAALVSLGWFEHMDTHFNLEPEQFAFSLMSRSKQITFENLRLRDAAAVDQVERWFAEKTRRDGYDVDTDEPVAPMFQPIRLRDMVLDNRVVVSPMAQYSAIEGRPTDWHFVHYGSRALGGAGLLITEMTCPSLDARITPGCACLSNETELAEWRRIVDFVHGRSPAKICLQLGHAGRKGSTQLGWEEMDAPLKEDNWDLIAPSPLPWIDGVNQVPREMTRADMDRVIGDFVHSVRLADRAGFDMIEAHFAHGYLLASFISPLTNRRTDEYGGSIENRMRFPLELFAAMRAAWPNHKPMSVRVSATDWHEDGLSEADLKRIADLLIAAGADLIDVSAGQTVPDQKPIYGRMFQTPFSDFVRNEAGAATMAVGNITTADQVNTIVASGRADLVALARPHLGNPYFTLQAAATYGHSAMPWPKQYLSAQTQAEVLAVREKEELAEMKRALKPPSHQVEEAPTASAAE